MSEHRTYLGGETARDEVNSARVGSVVTMDAEVVWLEDVITLITGTEYIVLTPTNPKDAVDTTVVLQKENWILENTDFQHESEEYD